MNTTGKSIEFETISRRGIRDNEDTLVATPETGIFAVFDGASSLTPYRTPDGKTGALVAAETAREVFASPGQRDLGQLTLLANQSIERKHQELGIDSSLPANRFACTIAAIRLDHKASSIELVQAGDSLVLVKFTNGEVSVPLGYHDHDLPIMKQWRKYADQGKTNFQSLFDEDTAQLRNQANKTYSVLNGDPAVANTYKKTTLKLSDISSILLLTDGLLLPKADPEASDNWSDYFRLCESGGLARLYDTVREMELSDPNLTIYPRYKLHDDATGIYIDVQSTGLAT